MVSFPELSDLQSTLDRSLAHSLSRVAQPDTYVASDLFVRPRWLQALSRLSSFASANVLRLSPLGFL